MSLTKDQVLQSTARLLAFFNPTQPQVDLYVSALLEAFGSWMYPHHFEEVCIHMLREVSLGRKPTPHDFLQLHRKIGTPKGWYAKTQKAVCASCGGTMLVSNLYRVIATGEISVFMTPCPDCGSKNWTVRDGLQLLSESALELSQITDARVIRPSVAKRILKEIEQSGKCVFNEKVILELTMRACEPEPPGAPAHGFMEVVEAAARAAGERVE